jgi:hypothetical protein
LREKDSKNPGALFWWVANRGHLASFHKSIGSLSVIRKLEKAMLDLKEIDPKFRSGGADRVLGRLYEEAPRGISIGSKSKAEKFVHEAYDKYPDFPGNQILYAEFLMGQDNPGKCLEAKALAKKATESSSALKQAETDPLDASEWKKAADAIEAEAKKRGNCS